MFFKKNANKGIKESSEIDRIESDKMKNGSHANALQSQSKDEKLLALLRQVNSLLKYITEQDYVKNMLLDVGKQVDMIDNISASSEEMASSIEDISNFVQDSNQSTLESISSANNSIELITSAFGQIEVTFEASQKVKETMQKLNDEAQKINNMVAIIKGVADQTNLLALNASIEAARAGEHGRGFAVVADEIKKLAESTKEQVDFIRQIVESLTKEIENTDHALHISNEAFELGKKQMSNAVEGLDIMKNGLNGISSAFMEIGANVEEQTAASQEMSSSVMIVNEKAKVLHGETNKTGLAFNAVSKIVNDIRLELLKDTPELDMKTQLEVCISDHLIWKWRVYNMILGYENLVESEVGTHHTCRLGKWCDNTEFSDDGFKRVVNQLEKPHSDLYELAKKAIKAYNGGDVRGAELALEEMDRASTQVVEHLNQMKKINRNS